MLEKEKLEKIQNISKETEIHEVLYDLLKSMGYENVQITHENGSVPEYGKDLIASRKDEVEGINEWDSIRR